MGKEDQKFENNRFLNQLRTGSDIYSETSQSEIDNNDFCEVNNRNTQNASNLYINQTKKLLRK